jgi:hypothetical protein
MILLIHWVARIIGASCSAQPNCLLTRKMKV